jgi:cell division septation protein DedD
LAHSTPDDGFREIQLNGKQLVFLFMAATVVSVVIFLCGVLVGRGVRPLDAAAGAAGAAGPVLNQAVLADPPPVSAGPAAQPAAAEPPPTPDELSYYERLEGDGPPVENLRATSGARPELAGEPPPPPPPAPARVPEPARGATAAAALVADAADVPTGDPMGPGYAVQVAALQARGEADTIASRLAGKGYPSYVMAPSDGAPASIYRVRVGKFESRREAEQVAARLEKEEQFRPWIVR